MERVRFKNCLEGVIVTLLGVFFTSLALSIPSNPVSMDIAWVNFFAQAKFFPLISGVVIIVLGGVLTAVQWKGKNETTPMIKDEIRRSGILFIMILVYAIMTMYISFLISTFIFLAVSLFYLNKGLYKMYLLSILVIVFTAVGAWLVPTALNIPMP